MGVAKIKSGRNWLSRGIDFIFKMMQGVIESITPSLRGGVIKIISPVVQFIEEMDEWKTVIEEMDFHQKKKL